MKLSKKLLISLLGFPFACLAIFLVYILIYIVLGRYAYISEILYLINISTLLKELIVLGTAISISIFSLLELNDLSIHIKNNKKHKVLFTIIALCLMIIGFALVPIIFSQIFLKDLIIFNKTFFMIWISFIAVFSLFQMIKDFINVWIINKRIKNI